MKYFILIACIATVQLWTVSALPKPKASASTPATALPSFEDFIAQAQANIKQVSEHLNEMVGLPKNADASTVFNVIKENTESYTKQLSGVVEKIKKEVDSAKTGELSQTVKSIQEKLEKQIEILKKEVESPEVKAKTKQIQENFSKSLNTIVEEASKLSKSVSGDKTISEDFQKLSKQLVDQAVKAADQVQQAVHEATGHEKDAHKH